MYPRVSNQRSILRTSTIIYEDIKDILLGYFSFFFFLFIYNKKKCFRNFSEFNKISKKRLVIFDFGLLKFFFNLFICILYSKSSNTNFFSFGFC